MLETLEHKWQKEEVRKNYLTVHCNFSTRYNMLLDEFENHPINPNYFKILKLVDVDDNFGGETMFGMNFYV